MSKQYVTEVFELTNEDLASVVGGVGVSDIMDGEPLKNENEEPVLPQFYWSNGLGGNIDLKKMTQITEDGLTVFNPNTVSLG
jgi:hypothetical protein